MPQRPVIILLYGVPGSGKTSLANTSNNPLLIDCDRGADRAVNRQDTLSSSIWEDIRDEGMEYNGGTSGTNPRFRERRTHE